MSRIRKIIQKYFGEDHSQEVQKEFASWIRYPYKQREKDEELRSIWDNLDIQADESTHQSYKKLYSKIETSAHSIVKVPLFQKISRIVAILLLPIISIGITYFVTKNTSITNDHIELVECIVPNGEVRTIILPDSSIVKINSGSVLIYPEQFRDNRNILLNGEAYFTVKRNESKPFIVKTTDMNVEVLGTVFNVSSYSDSENSTTTLETGSVNIIFRDKNKAPVLLAPNEQIVYNRKSKLVEKNVVKVDNTIAWIQGNLVIQSMTIDEISRIIERKYAVTVYLNSNEYTNERITMKITNGETISEFMSVLQYLVPKLKYKIEKDKLYIY